MIAQMKLKSDDKKEKKRISDNCVVLVNVIGRNEKRETYLALINTGTSATLVNRAAVKFYSKNRKKDMTGWQTQVGPFDGLF